MALDGHFWRGGGYDSIFVEAMEDGDSFGSSVLNEFSAMLQVDESAVSGHALAVLGLVDLLLYEFISACSQPRTFLRSFTWMLLLS